MTTREKAKLRRIIESNTREYREQRRQLVQRALSGFDGGMSSEFVAERRRWLALHAIAIAEATSDLLAHADDKEHA